MPNWCENYITIHGPTKILEEIFDAANKNKLLEYLEPIGDWDYNKAVEAWGTKWEPQEVTATFHTVSTDAEGVEDTYYITAWFDTAWSPPVNAYYAAEKRLGITIEAFYIEEGMGFVGKYTEGTEETYELDFEMGFGNIPEHITEACNLSGRRETWLEWKTNEENENV